MGLLIWVLVCGSSRCEMGCFDMMKPQGQKEPLFRSRGKDAYAGDGPTLPRLSASYGIKESVEEGQALDAGVHAPDIVRNLQGFSIRTG